jgi:hypothetical protein
MPLHARSLDLTIGPTHLDLLGLVVDTNQIHLTITGEQGPGNLLGNLLCGIAGLLGFGRYAEPALEHAEPLLRLLG